MGSTWRLSRSLKVGARTLSKGDRLLLEESAKGLTSVMKITRLKIGSILVFGHKKASSSSSSSSSSSKKTSSSKSSSSSSSSSSLFRRRRRRRRASGIKKEGTKRESTPTPSS